MEITDDMAEEWRSEWFFSPQTVPMSRFMAEKGAEHALASISSDQGDTSCAEDDGCPTEKAVLQRFWREQHANLSANKNMGGASPMCTCGEPMAPGVKHSTTKPCYVMGAEEMKGAWSDPDLKALTDAAFAADEEIMRKLNEQGSDIPEPPQ